MTRTTTRAILRCLAIGLVLASAARPAHALISVCNGDRPVKNLGWPLGCEKVGNVPGRLGYTVGPPFGGGRYTFYFTCRDTGSFSVALIALASIRTPRVELVVHDGPGPEYSHGEDEKRPRVDWTFTVWHPENWHRLYNNPTSTFACDQADFRKPVAPPRIDVYVGEGEIVWDAVEVPENVHVVDRRAEAAPVRPVGGGVVCGDVYDMATGQPVAGAEVSLVRRRGREKPEVVARGLADAMGSVEIRKIPAGTYSIDIRAKGYASRGLSYYRNRGKSYHEFITELMREASISGVVTGVDGKPIGGARVTAWNTLAIDGLGYDCIDAQPAETAERGRFEMSGLPGGYTGLRCHARTLHQTTPIFKLFEAPSKDVAIVMVGTGVVRGTVVGEDGKPPQQPGDVHLEPKGGARPGTWSSSTRCQPDGSFELRGVPPGTYLLSTNPRLGIDGDDPKAVAVTVKAGQTADVQLRK